MMATWELPGARLTEDLKSGETAAGGTDGLHGMASRTGDALAPLPPSRRRYRRPNTAAAFFGLRRLRSRRCRIRRRPDSASRRRQQ